MMKTTATHNTLSPWRHCLTVAASALLTALTLGSCQRDLWVGGDEFHSVTLDVDWRQYTDHDPDGMTVWFYPSDETREPYRFVTSEVRHFDLYLAADSYRGVVIDYTPEEYSNQVFEGLDRAETARVVARPASYQADSVPALYGMASFHTMLPTMFEDSGLYTIVDQMEDMGLDTICDRIIQAGEYGDYIPYGEQDEYQQTLVIQRIEAEPRSLLWKLRIRIAVHGFDNIWQTEGTVAGLSNGHYLVRDRNTDEPCLIYVGEWETTRTGDDEGYISTTITTFGLRSSQRPVTAYDKDSQPLDFGALTQDDPSGWALASPMEDIDLRVNLHFTLRDHATIRDYHFDVGRMVVGYPSQQVLRVDLLTDGWSGGETPDLPDLPYVDAYGGTGFDATVTPWDEQGQTDIVM